MNETLVTCDGCGQQTPQGETTLLSDNRTRLCNECIEKTGKTNPKEEE